MRQEWFIIDRWGRRPIHRADARPRSVHGADEIDWPPFNQLVTRAPTHLVVKALQTFTSMLDVQLLDVTDAPQRWLGAVLVGQCGDVVLVSEPGTELDERLLHPDSADAIHGLLADDGAFFGYQPESGTVHVTRYELGAPTMEWWDSVAPGPSFARTYEANGRAQDEEPRQFALRALGLPPAQPMLDRHEFVAHVLRSVGLERLAPEFDDVAIAHAFRLT